MRFKGRSTLHISYNSLQWKKKGNQWMEISMPLMSRRDADPSDDFFLFLLRELPQVALM